MKIDNITLYKMEIDIKIIANHFNINLKSINTNQLNNIWFHVYMNRNYNTNNPNVIKDNNGNRLLTQIDNFELYPNETNDTTIYSAWNKLISKWSK